MMQLGSRQIAIQNETLRVLIRELGDECNRVLELIHQLQLPDLQDSQKADILAELNASTLHLYAHCDEDLQGAIAAELERLSDD